MTSIGFTFRFAPFAASAATGLWGIQSQIRALDTRGKSVEGLEAAMVAAVKTKLDAAVAAGKITAAEEQTKLARVQRLVDRLVSAKLAGKAGRHGKARLLRLGPRPTSA